MNSLFGNKILKIVFKGIVEDPCFEEFFERDKIGKLDNPKMILRVL